MPTPLKLLLVEDNPDDAELVLRELRRAGFAPDYRHVDNEADFREALGGAFDIVLSDYHLPAFSGLRALELLNERGLDTPFILVSGTIGEDVAVEAIKSGAADYLLKDRLARLGSAVDHALDQARARRARRRAEDELRLFRALVDQAEDTIEVVDLATARYLDVNAKGCAELGYTREEYLSFRVPDIDPTSSEAGWRALVEKLEATGSHQGESVHRRKDGTTFPVEVRARRVRLDRDYLVASVRDISTRRQAEQSLRESEERFRQLAENIQEVFWMADPITGALLYVSPAYETIWGRSCASLHARSDDWLEAIHPDDRARVVAAFARQAEGTYHETYRIMRPDGSLRWVRDRAFPIRDAHGRVYRVVGTAEDITDRRELEEQFRQTQKLEAIGTLAGGVAHDFNNILSAIIGYSELADAFLPDGAASRRHIGMVLQAAHRAAALVRQILAFSRQEEERWLAVQLRPLVEEPLKLLRATTPAMIEFDVALDEDLPPVLADPTQIHQIVMNLGTNAAHAMGERPGRLEVRLERHIVGEARPAPSGAGLQPGIYVRLSVGDTGCGMDQTTQARIFEPFFTTKGRGEGTGLGLSVVHGIMQRHGGAITVWSRPGEGTVFYLYFPTGVGVTEPATPAEGEPAAPAGEGRRVLFVDDEEPLAQLGGAVLEILGYRPTICLDATEALGLVRRSPQEYDLVITDLSMPGMTGLDLARRLAELLPDLPVILTTGHASDLSYEAARRAGVRELLTKPFTLGSLGMAAHRATETKARDF